MKKFVLAITLLLLTGCVFQDYQMAKAVDDSYKEVKLNHSYFTVPAGAKFRAIVTSPINSGTAFAGQPVTLVLSSDFYYNSDKIASAGSTVNGTVTEVSKAKHGSLNGKMSLRFTSIVTPEGGNIPINAIVKTINNSGVMMGGEIYTTNLINETSLPSAIPVNAVSPLSISKDVSVTRTAGNGGGLVKSIWDKGLEVIVPANATLELVLTQPITVKTKFAEN